MPWKSKPPKSPDKPLDWSDYQPGHPIELVDIPITARGEIPKDGSRFSVPWSHNLGQHTSLKGMTDNPVYRLMLDPSHVFLITRLALRFDDKQPPAFMGQGRLWLHLGSRVYGDWPLFLFADTGIDGWYTLPLDRPLFIASLIPLEVYMSDVWPAGRFYSLVLCGDRGRPLA